MNAKSQRRSTRHPQALQGCIVARRWQGTKNSRSKPCTAFPGGPTTLATTLLLVIRSTIASTASAAHRGITEYSILQYYYYSVGPTHHPSNPSSSTSPPLVYFLFFFAFWSYAFLLLLIVCPFLDRYRGLRELGTCPSLPIRDQSSSWFNLCFTVAFVLFSAVHLAQQMSIAAQSYP